MGLVLVTAPATEPLGPDDVKDHLRISGTTEDTVIEALIIAARQYVEEVTGRALITQTWRATWDSWPCSDQFGGSIRLPKPTLQSVTWLKYYAGDGTLTTLSAPSYSVDTDSEPGRIVPAYQTFWPTIRCVPNAVQVQYVAGYGDTAATVPDALKEYMKLLIGAMYENREAEVTGTITSELKFADGLLWPYRMLSFA